VVGLVSIILLVVGLGEALVRRNPSGRGVERLVGPRRARPSETPPSGRSLGGRILKVIGVVVFAYLALCVIAAVGFSLFVATTCKKCGP
jgi:hypothetical protein